MGYSSYQSRSQEHRTAPTVRQNAYNMRLPTASPKNRLPGAFCATLRKIDCQWLGQFWTPITPLVGLYCTPINKLTHTMTGRVRDNLPLLPPGASQLSSAEAH